MGKDRNDSKYSDTLNMCEHSDRQNLKSIEI